MCTLNSMKTPLSADLVSENTQYQSLIMQNQKRGIKCNPLSLSKDSPRTTDRALHSEMTTSTIVLMEIEEEERKGKEKEEKTSSHWLGVQIHV